MDCPNCAVKVKKVRGLKKHEKRPILRKYKGGVDTKHYGYNPGSTPNSLNNPIPLGAMIVDRCRSCGWVSIHRYDGEKIRHDKGVSTTWRLIVTGVGVDPIPYLKKYGFK